jgi:hypothetical protein
MGDNVELLVLKGYVKSVNCFSILVDPSLILRMVFRFKQLVSASSADPPGKIS